jgi:hypothetical protein
VNSQQKNRLVAGIAIAIILGSCLLIYLTQFKDAVHNVSLHKHIGEVLAQQAAKALGPKGRIVSIAIDTKDWPELKIQLQAFRAKLKKLGEYELREYEMDTKDQPKYGVGSGLSGRRYVRTVNKNTNANLFVSFIGAPKLSAEEIAELTIKPKLVVESRSGDNLPSLFENKLVIVAIVSRFQFPAPSPEKPRTVEEWFQKRYQIVTSESVQGLQTRD